MNAVRQTLAELHGAPGINAVAVVTMDGLVAAESLDERYRGDVIGGLASYLLMTTTKSLAEGGLGSCAQVTVHATHGRVILTALEDAYLVAVFDQFADSTEIRGLVAAAAERLRALTRVG